MNDRMKKFSLRMAVLALCLLILTASLSSCGFFIETFLGEYTGVRTSSGYGDERTTERKEYLTEPEDITVNDVTEQTSPHETETQIAETTTPETTVPETTNNIPDELEEHVYLQNIDRGRCGKLLGQVTVTVIVTSDKVSSWDAASRAELVASLSDQEKLLEEGAQSYGAELDVTYSFIDVQIDSEAKPTEGLTDGAWENTALKAAGFTSKDKAQSELDAKKDADSNPILIVLNKTGRAYARQQASISRSEICVVYSSDYTSFRHELYHLYGAEDFYYPAEVKELCNSYLPESIMNDGSKTDALTAFIIGWDEEIDTNAYDFLKNTSHLTKDYLDKANKEQQKTGYVTNHTLTYGTYTGYLEMGVPMGAGKLSYTGGAYAEGTFLGGNLNGYGLYRWNDGTVYEGDFIKGVRTGNGKMTYADGAVYEGGFLEGELHGTGTLRWADGTAYTGDFVKGERSGKGTYVWPNGNKYVGDFINGVRSGNGIYTTPDGYRYEGAWADNDYHGYGVARYAEGSVYEGYFYKGVRHGKGTYIWKNGAKYTGDFVNGKFEGQGTYTTPDGYKYVGAWKNDDYNGYGTAYYTGGSVYQGNFVNGSRNGYGVMTWSDGSRYDGYWANNQQNGYGKYTNKNGTVFEGQWINNVFQG